MFCYPDSPTAGSINEIKDQGDDRANNKNARKQHQCHNHFLHKVDLQGYESTKGKPQPLSSFSFAECLTDLH